MPYDHNFKHDSDDDEEFENEDFDEAYQALPIDVMLDNRYMFKLISSHMPKVIYKVYPLKTVNCEDLYNEIIESDRFDFKISSITGMVIRSKAGYISVDDIKKITCVVLEYTILPPNMILNTDGMNIRTLSERCSPINGDLNEIRSDSLYECIPQNKNDIKDIAKMQYIYVNYLTIEDRDKRRLSIDLEAIYNNFKLIENEITNHLNNFGVTNITYKKIYSVDFSENTMQFIIRYFVNKINGARVLSFTPENITIEDNEEINENLSDTICTSVPDLFSNNTNIIVARMMDKINSFRSPDGILYSTYNIYSDTYSVDTKNPTNISYTKQIYDSYDLAIYKKDGFFKSKEPPYLVIMCEAMYKDMMDKTKESSKFEEIIKNIPSIKNIKKETTLLRKNSDMLYLLMR